MQSEEYRSALCTRYDIRTIVNYLRRVWRYQREITIRKSKDRKHNDQKEKGHKDKQRSTKHYTKSLRSGNTNHKERTGKCLRQWNISVVIYEKIFLAFVIYR